MGNFVLLHIGSLSLQSVRVSLGILALLCEKMIGSRLRVPTADWSHVRLHDPGSVEKMASVTLDLLGELGRSYPDALSETAQHPIASQLTIFYKGTVHVYDDVSADKAHALMVIAANCSNHRRQTSEENATLVAEDNSNFNSSLLGGGNCDAFTYRTCASPTDTSKFSGQPICRSSITHSSSSFHVQQSDRRPAKLLSKRTQTELPFARKASLARFLQKRKERADLAVENSANEDMTDAAKKKVRT
ncbi:hypothetical protein KP509_07G033600 [Ceratopteris richardii]|uniref:Tify domain-containing protein n=1 Tax=Ceratopteris richardii TaxID=49495 RepID=A0A8T2UFV2_CERRI|nr:hypothetical protein KP509_07G033600 [Ceratopteris richardii]